MFAQPLSQFLFWGAVILFAFVVSILWGNRQFQKKLLSFHQRQMAKFHERHKLLQEMLQESDFHNELTLESLPPRLLTGYPYLHLKDYQGAYFRVNIGGLAFHYSYSSSYNQTFSLLSFCCEAPLSSKAGELTTDNVGRLLPIAPYTFLCYQCAAVVGEWNNHELFLSRNEATEELLFNWLDTQEPESPLNNGFKAGTLAQDLQLLAQRVQKAVELTNGVSILAN